MLTPEDIISYIKMVDVNDYSSELYVNGLCYGDFKDLPEEFNLKLLSVLVTVYYTSYTNNPVYRDEAVVNPALTILGEDKYRMRIGEFIHHILNMIAGKLYSMSVKEDNYSDLHLRDKLVVVVREVYILHKRTWVDKGYGDELAQESIEDIIIDYYKQKVPENPKDGGYRVVKAIKAWGTIYTPTEYIEGFN